ncbi:MAG: DUF4178 domain-containing protein [Polyangiaceae bacterium]|nr:DUF4178 domain-containing protein [Polyangiaceae bacterium]
MLDRQAPCPNCGATLTFKFAGARAQVCKYCKFLVARTDRGLVRVGQVADLVEIPSPLAVGRGGYWERKRFEVEGRIQLDRVGAASAPWQEFFIQLPDSGDGYWIAFAQGRWYWTKEITPAPQLPPMQMLRPGAQIQLPAAGLVTISEVGRRRIVSEEGELPNVPAPGAITPYADFAGPNGVFGTLDYGDGQSIAPSLYVGRQFDPGVFKLDSGAPLEVPKAEVKEASCPTCGGSLPLVAPGTTERIVCRYCGTISDLRQGGLAALGQAPKPPIQPFIPLGAEGTLRGRKVIMIGFVMRGTFVEGEHYGWREYLLYAGPSDGYIWLMEEDDRWQLVVPVPTGEIQMAGSFATLAGKTYNFKQSVQAQVEYVVGELYWKVEIGETVQATEFQGPDGILSVERDANEVNTSFCHPLTAQEIGQAFNIAPPPSPGLFAAEPGSSSSERRGCSPVLVIVLIVVAIILLILIADCDGGGSSGGGSGIYIGPGIGGK